MPQFPDNLVWNHPVCQHEAYRPYAQQVSAFAQEEERPSQLAQAMPVLSDYLKTMDARSEARVAELKAELKAELQAVTAQSARLQTLLTTGLTFEVKAAGS
jgi:hypothetical protein